MSSGLLDQSLSPGAAVSVEEGKMTTATVEGEFVEGLVRNILEIEQDH